MVVCENLFSPSVSLLLLFIRTKSKSFFLFTYSRETGFSFSYGKVGALLGLIAPLDEMNRVSKLDNSL